MAYYSCESPVQIIIDAAPYVTLERSSVYLGLYVPTAVLDRLTRNAPLVCAVLLGRYTGHVWAPCDQCGGGLMAKRNTKPRCRMTKGCEGKHVGESLPKWLCR